MSVQTEGSDHHPSGKSCLVSVSLPSSCLSRNHSTMNQKHILCFRIIFINYNYTFSHENVLNTTFSFKVVMSVIINHL